MLKKEYCVIGVLLILICLLPFAVGANETFGNETGKMPKFVNNTGMWGLIKTKVGAVGNGISGVFGKASKFVNDKILWALGVKNYSGENVWLFSKAYWISSSGKWFGLDSPAMNNILFALLLTVWISCYLPFITKITINRSLSRSSMYSFYSQQGQLGFFETMNRMKMRILRRAWNLLWKLELWFIILGGIPIVNRIVQILMLDFLSMGLLLRSLVMAHIIVFIYAAWDRIVDSRKEMSNYRKKLEEYAIHEMEKAELGD